MNKLPTLKTREIPENVRGGECARRDAARLRAKLTDPNEVCYKNGALYWVCVNRPVPMWTFDEAFVVPPAGQQAARDADVEKSLAEYRKARKNHVPSAEEQFEMRAAFGPGQTVVDVITGQTFRT